MSTVCSTAEKRTETRHSALPPVQPHLRHRNIEGAIRRGGHQHFHQLLHHQRSRKNSAKRTSSGLEILGRSISCSVSSMRSCPLSRCKIRFCTPSITTRGTSTSRICTGTKLSMICSTKRRRTLSCGPATSGRGAGRPPPGSSSVNWKSSGPLAAMGFCLRRASFAASTLSVFCALRLEYFASAATLSKLWWTAWSLWLFLKRVDGMHVSTTPFCELCSPRKQHAQNQEARACAVLCGAGSQSQPCQVPIAASSLHLNPPLNIAPQILPPRWTSLNATQISEKIGARSFSGKPYSLPRTSSYLHPTASSSSRHQRKQAQALRQPLRK